MFIKRGSFNEAIEHWCHGDQHLLYKMKWSRRPSCEAIVLSCFSFAWCLPNLAPIGDTRSFPILIDLSMLEITTRRNHWKCTDGGQRDGQMCSWENALHGQVWDHPIHSCHFFLLLVWAIQRFFSSVGHRSTSRIGPHPSGTFNLYFGRSIWGIPKPFECRRWAGGHLEKVMVYISQRINDQEWLVIISN